MERKTSERKRSVDNVTTCIKLSEIRFFGCEATLMVVRVVIFLEGRDGYTKPMDPDMYIPGHNRQ